MKKQELCLVTGGAGFIGSHLVEGLLAEGYRVRVFDNLSTGKSESLDPFRSRIEWIEGDLRNESDVRRAVEGIDYLFHVAANRAVLRSVDNPLETNEVNVKGTLQVLLAARDAKVKRVIFSSSSSVYGDTEKFPSEETDKPNPLSPYAASKLMGEYYGRIFTQLYALDTVLLRYFNVFGPRQNPESKYSAVIPLFIQSLVGGKSPEVHWDGKQSRDFTYVANVVHGNLLAMKTPAAKGEIFNIACRNEYSVLDIFESLKRILNQPSVKPVFRPKRAGDVRRTFADISKAERILGYKVLVDFETGLRKTVEWFLTKIPVALLVALFAFSSLGEKTAQAASEKPAVTVNKLQLTQEELRQEYQTASRSTHGVSGAKAEEPEWLSRVIERELLVQEAQRLGLDRERDFMRTIERFWKEALIKLLLDHKAEEIGARTHVYDPEIEAAYKKMLEQEGTAPPIEEVREEIKRDLLGRKETQAMEEWIQELRAKAKIVVDSESVKELEGA